MAARRQPMRLTPDLVARAFRPVPDPGPREGQTLIDDTDVATLVASLLAARPARPRLDLRLRLPDLEAGLRPGGDAPRPRPRLAPLVLHRARRLARHARGAGADDGPRPGRQLHRPRLPARPGHGGRRPRRPRAARDAVPRAPGNARWITVETADGPLPALTFYASPTGTRTSHGLPLETVAHRLAHACGYAGSCAEYLHNTVAHLEAEGIRDRNLWRLQRLVAAEIAGW